MIPKIDGVEVCRRIRSAGDTPIIILTARDSVTDKIAGLDAGADDYVTKPSISSERACAPLLAAESQRMK